MTRYPPAPLTAAVLVPAVLVLVASAGLSVVGPAEARFEKKSVTVPGDRQTLLWTHADLAKDCTVSPAPGITLVSPPSHGRIATQETVQAIADGTSPCNGMQVPATGVYFVPTDGYVGEDHFRYKWTKQDGTTGLDTSVEVKVR